MSPQLGRSLMWMAGPAVAVALAALATLGNVGPGLLFLLLTSSAAFMIGTPILQLALLSTTKYRARYAAACRIAMATVLVGLLVPASLGVFSFW